MVFTKNHGFLGQGEGAENIEEKKKTDRRKTLKNGRKEKQTTRGKSNNNNENIWHYVLCKAFYLA